MINTHKRRNKILDQIKVKILEHNLNGMPLFLAKMTQRGSEINSMEDLMKLYTENIDKTPSDKLLQLPHTTIFRMCNMTVAIYGLSTKAVSQLRTHATRLTFMSTSTQYSEYTGLDCPYVIPEGLTEEEKESYKFALKRIHEAYSELYKGMIIRKRYRYYFARRTVSSLLKLIKPNDISFRTKLSYIKQHILYILSKK